MTSRTFFAALFAAASFAGVIAASPASATMSCGEEPCQVVARNSEDARNEAKARRAARDAENEAWRYYRKYVR
jgi:hypothetical protein